MITIKQIQNNATVTDGTDTVTLGAGDSYTCSPPVINEYMELVIDTTISGGTPSDSFSLAIKGNGVVDWGEGAGDEFFSSTTTGIDASNTHQYLGGGVYTVRLKGFFTIAYNSNTDRAKITNLKNSGYLISGLSNNVWTNCINMECSATDLFISSGNDSSNMFSGCSNLVTPPKLATTSHLIEVNNWLKNTSLNADLGYMDLRQCNNFINFAQGVNTWSTENYGATLLGWLRWDSTTHAPAVGWVLQSNQNFHGGSSTLVTGSEAALARDYLINTLNWTITDGGLT